MNEDEECKKFLTLFSLLNMLACNNNNITTIRKEEEEEEEGKIFLTDKNFLTYSQIWELISDSALILTRHTQDQIWIINFLLKHGAFTIHTAEIEKRFDPPNILHEITRPLELQGIVRKELQRPFEGGKNFAVWVASWATNLQIQSKIEEHNLYLKRGRTKDQSNDYVLTETEDRKRQWVPKGRGMSE